MSSVSDAAERKIGAAALLLFARHGFQRTSMADVAREAGVARATLYLRFRDKTALFEHLAQRVADDALAAAAEAWKPDAELAANIEALILAKDLPLFRLLHASPHGAELMAVDAELTRAHADRLEAGFAALLAGHARALDGADFAAFDGAEGFGHFLAVAAAGLKHEARSETAYRESVSRLSRVAAQATRALSANMDGKNE